jgi:hypothetical protein
MSVPCFFSGKGDVLELRRASGVKTDMLDTEEVLSILETFGEIKVNGGGFCSSSAGFLSPGR